MIFVCPSCLPHPLLLLTLHTLHLLRPRPVALLPRGLGGGGGVRARLRGGRFTAPGGGALVGHRGVHPPCARDHDRAAQLRPRTAAATAAAAASVDAFHAAAAVARAAGNVRLAQGIRPQRQ